MTDACPSQQPWSLFQQFRRRFFDALLILEHSSPCVIVQPRPIGSFRTRSLGSCNGCANCASRGTPWRSRSKLHVQLPRFAPRVNASAEVGPLSVPDNSWRTTALARGIARGIAREYREIHDSFDPGCIPVGILTYITRGYMFYARRDDLASQGNTI